MKIKAKSSKSIRKIRAEIHLPGDYAWKVASRLAGDLREFLNESDYNRYVTIVRNKDVEAYLLLSEDWGLQCFPLSDAAPAEKRAKYQLASLLKKFRFESEREQRCIKARDKFLAYEKHCASYNHVDYMEFANGRTTWSIEIFTYARAFLRKLLGISLPSGKCLTEWSRHGPGSTIGTKNGFISAYHKYADWPYSCTFGAERHARYVISMDERWLGALQDSYRGRFNIPKHYPLNLSHFWTSVIKIVDGNRITFVPKDAKIERPIAIEPTLNLYLQLGVDGYIRRRLKRWGVDLDSQEKNKELARLGSIDNSFSTIDISGASDTVSLKLCKMLLPEAWYDYLLDLRSPNGVLGEDVISYEKISSMGNGFTFALESAIFTALVFAVHKADRRPLIASEFAVFGDDLVIRNDLHFKLVEALRLAGFAVNNAKSFNFGFIRESCGTDWFRGIPVRPVFLVDTPASVMDLFVDLNRLKRCLELRWCLEKSNTTELLTKWVPEIFKNLFGPYSNEEFDAYIHCKYPVRKYRNCMWTYSRLIVQPVPQQGNQFLFRKLMSTLRQSPLPVNKWDKMKGQGSVFTVTRRNFSTVSVKKNSRTSFWCDEYDEVWPQLTRG